MKTKLFLFAVIMMSVLSQKTIAQDLQMATLQHGDTMKAFYGSEALNDALASAETGDIISLSAGVFTAPAITKAVTIQGAGYMMDQENNRYRTTLLGEATVNIPNGEKGLLLEGLHTQSDFTIDGDSLCGFIIRKCRLSKLTINAKAVNGEIGQSKIYQLDWTETRNLFIHHVVMHQVYGNNKLNEEGVVIDHCVVTGHLENNVTAVIQNSMIKNARGTNACAFYNNVITQNSISNSYYSYMISSNTLSGNTIWTVTVFGYDDCPSEYSSLFVTAAHAWTWNDTYDYKLTDEAATTYTCNDGTQIGLYGGTVPFTDVPTTPQIISKTIATQTDENGMLSVKIQVEAQ